MKKILVKVKTNVILNTFFPENSAFYEVKWGNMALRKETADGTITRRMRFACWMNKATDLNSEYLILLR